MKKAMFLLAAIATLLYSCSENDLIEGKNCEQGYFGHNCDSQSVWFYSNINYATRTMPDTDSYFVKGRLILGDTINFAIENLMDENDSISCIIDSFDRYGYYIPSQSVNGKLVYGYGHVYDGYYTADFWADSVRYLLKVDCR